MISPMTTLIAACLSVSGVWSVRELWRFAKWSLKQQRTNEPTNGSYAPGNGRILLTSSEYERGCKAAQSELDENGLNPFDLIPWSDLLELHIALKAMTHMIDIETRMDLLEQVEKAMKREAAHLDNKHKVQSHTETYRKLIAE